VRARRAAGTRAPRLEQHVLSPFQGHQVAHARPELLGREGLGQVVLGAFAQQLDAKSIVRLRRQQDDRDTIELGARPQVTRQLVAALARHHHVGQHKVGAQLDRLAQAFLAVERDLGSKFDAMG